MSKTPTPEQQAAAERYGDIAMKSDSSAQALLAFLIASYPEDEDAIVSGAMTALVRFGIERAQDAEPLRLLTVRDVFSYFARYVQTAAEILLTRPAKPNG